MTPHLSLERIERPRPKTRDVVGTDGLTDAQRQEYRLQYLSGQGRRRLDDDEKRAIAEWLKKRRG